MHKDRSLTLSQIGCAMFRGAGITGGGFASVMGEEAFRFSSADQLHESHPDTLWVTSAAQTVFIREGGLRKEWLRDGLFFSTPVVNLAEEIGASNDLALAAKSISTIFTRVLLLARRHIPGLTIAGGRQSFVQLIGAYVYGPKPHMPLHADVEQAIEGSFVTPLPAGGKSAGNDLVIRIPLQRVAQLQHTLKSQVPAGAWKEVPVSGLLNPLDWVLKSEAPVMALVSIVKVHEKIAGFSARGIGRGTRVWMAHPEIRLLNGCVDIKIDRIFQADQYVSCASGFRTPPPSLDPIDHISVSSGLFAEAFLSAICAPISIDGATGPEGAPVMNAFYSQRSAWLLSNARAYVFAEAVKLMANDFSVIGYGLSHVMISCPKNSLPSLRDYLRINNNLLIPAKYAAAENSTTPQAA